MTVIYLYYHGKVEELKKDLIILLPSENLNESTFGISHHNNIRKEVKVKVEKLASHLRGSEKFNQITCSYAGCGPFNFPRRK